MLLIDKLKDPYPELDEDKNDEEKPPEEELDGIKLDIPADILEICLKYMHYKTINRRISYQRPNFPIEPPKALDVLKAALYLGC